MKSKENLVWGLIVEYQQEVAVSGMSAEAYIIIKSAEKINNKYELGLSNEIQKVKEVI